MSELLMPAGSIEKMKYAFAYGADAVYLGLADFSLRALRKGELINESNLADAVKIAHELGKKVYCTFNIFAYDDDIEKLKTKIEIIKTARPDALIITDMGVLRVLKKELQNLDIEFHISTQTNILNSEAVKFYRDLGAKRVILARELSFSKIEKIRKKVPDVELEMFVHGAQCMAYSGRCLLSDYLTKGKRLANQGACAQSCRWSYKLVEETRPNEQYEIIQDNFGSHIMSTKDLCLIKHIQKLKEIGVDSFKIEGRTKSLYYVSAVAKIYRQTLDGKIDPDFAFEELKKVGNRGYCEGFFLDNNNCESYSYDISKGLAGSDFLGIIEKKFDNNSFRVLIKNKIQLNDEIELISPDYQQIVKVNKITHDKKGETATANTNDEINLELLAINDENSSNEAVNNNWDEIISQSSFALLRTKGLKEF